MRSSLFSKLRNIPLTSYTLSEMYESIENNINNIIEEKSNELDEERTPTSVDEIREYYKKKF